MEKQLGSSKKKKIVWGIIISIIIILGLLFVFKNNIKAIYYGVDVKYFNDPKYCQSDADCTVSSCNAVINIYNFKLNYRNSDFICASNFCGDECKKNSCIVKLCGDIK